MFDSLIEESKKQDLSNTYREWGQSIILSSTILNGEVVNRQKLLKIKAGASLPLHKHVNYAEMWIADSTFQYVIEDDKGVLTEGEASAYERIYVPKNRRHKIGSFSNDVTIFEIHMGIVEDSDNIRCD